MNAVLRQYRRRDKRPSINYIRLTGNTNAIAQGKGSELFEANTSVDRQSVGETESGESLAEKFVAIQ